MLPNISIINGTFLTDVHFMSLAISLLFCTTSLVLTIYLVVQHLKYWTDPIGQTYIVRILFVVPIYAICTYLSMILIDYSLYFDLVRDCYESFVLYQFLCLLIHYFHKECKKLDESADIPQTTDDDSSFCDNTTIQLDHDEKASKLSKKEENLAILRSTGEYLARYVQPREHQCPCCCCPLIIPNEEFLIKVKRFVAQYIVIKPLMTLVAVLLHLGDWYHSGSFSPYHGYIWVAIIVNFSAFLALYWLFTFFEAIRKIIVVYNPISKFLAIKLLIFFIFWQSVVISFIYYFNGIPSIAHLSSHESAGILNNFIISFEIVVLSICHIKIFPYDEFKNNDDNAKDVKLKRSLSKSMKAIHKVLNPTDIMIDTQTVFTINTDEKKD